MPQRSQIVGVNSVTNIELDKGVMPVAIDKNADWFEKLPWSVSLAASSCPAGDVQRRPKVHAVRIASLFLTLYRIVANGRFTRA